MSNKRGSRSGIGFVGMLTILFIGLKLTDHINWSWWWVLSPIWICIIALIVMFLLCLAFYLNDKR